MPVLGSGGAAGAALALLAAVSWGGGDFAGGMGSKAAGSTMRGALRVMITAHGLSLAVLGTWLVAQHQLLLRGWPVFWGLGCGVVAGLSITAFYMALARGAMGASAAVSGLLAAAIPAVVGILLEGRPSGLRLTGFLVAAIAIWMVAAPEPSADAGQNQTLETHGTMGLAIAGGIGFGLYFAGLKFANSLGVIEPLVLARTGSVLTCLFLYFGYGRKAKGLHGVERWLSKAGWGWALGVAVLDTGGNLLYIAATRAGRLDVAAVLASLYPASTILLAAAVLHERPGRRQLLGMGLAGVAVVLVTLHSPG